MKESIHTYCLSLINERIQGYLSALKDAHESLINETKSSAGDKHETSREMASEELRKLEMNLDEWNRRLVIVSSIDPLTKCKQVTKGALVETDQGYFYIAASIGNVRIAEQSVYLISPEAPIAMAMRSLVIGDCFTLNARRYCIKSIQ